MGIKVIYKEIDAPEEERDAKIMEAFRILIEASNSISKKEKEAI